MVVVVVVVVVVEDAKTDLHFKTLSAVPHRLSMLHVFQTDQASIRTGLAKLFKKVSVLPCRRASGTFASWMEGWGRGGKGGGKGEGKK